MKNININNRIITKISVLAFTLLLLIGCSKLSLEELSIDPNNPTSANLDLLLTNSESDILGGQQFGRNWDRYSGAFDQYFAGNHATGIEADRYLLTASEFQNTFNVPYRTGLKDADVIIVTGSENGDWKHVGIAKILMATSLGHLTDIYGDIPYSEAFKGFANAYPKYDTQKDIYDAIFKLLEESIADLDKPSTTDLSKSADIIFKGDLTKWKSTANLLLARYKNHLSKVDPSQSAKDALKYVDAAIALGIGNSSNYEFKHDGSTDWINPWYTLYENNLIIASEKFMNLLKSTNDPRLRTYWDDKPFNYPVNDGVLGFVGKKNGLPTGSDSFSPVGPQTYYGKKDSPLLVATYFELKFIEAEAALRDGNTSRAANALNDAVKAQLDLVTPNVEDLITVEKGDLSAYKTMVSNYINMYASETPGSINLEKIMTEKYKAMFTMNVETWTDLRRHDFQYPSGYIALPSEANLSEYIRRGLYPQSELDNNSESVPKGVTMTNRLWWDK